MLLRRKRWSAEDAKNIVFNWIIIHIIAVATSPYNIQMLQNERVLVFNLFNITKRVGIENFVYYHVMRYRDYTVLSANVIELFRWYNWCVYKWSCRYGFVFSLCVTLFTFMPIPYIYTNTIFIHKHKLTFIHFHSIYLLALWIWTEQILHIKPTRFGCMEEHEMKNFSNSH